MPGDMNRVREGRSEKREALHALESGVTHIEGLLRTPDGPLAKTDLWDLLLHTPKLNRKGATRVCMESGVFAHKQLGQLSDHERELVVTSLPKRVRAVGGERTTDEYAADSKPPHAPR